MVVMIIPAIVVIVIALRAVMMIMVVTMMMPPTVMVMTIIADICAGSPRMSALGQKRCSVGAPMTSGPPQLTDILRARRHVANVPLPEVMASFDHIV